MQKKKSVEEDSQESKTVDCEVVYVVPRHLGPRRSSVLAEGE